MHRAVFPQATGGRPLEAVFLISPEETCDIKSFWWGGGRQPFPTEESESWVLQAERSVIWWLSQRLLLVSYLPQQLSPGNKYLRLC